MITKSGQVEVVLKLTRSGRYQWAINYQFPIEELERGVNDLKRVDSVLKDQFPNFVQSGVRTKTFSEL